MKWVEASPNFYKFVPDDDSRPAVTLPSKPLGSPFTPFVPSWRKYEQNYFSPNSLDPERKSDNRKTDAFLAERDFQTRTDPKARRWEQSRKEEWARNKPEWRKRMMKEGVIQ